MDFSILFSLLMRLSLFYCGHIDEYRLTRCTFIPYFHKCIHSTFYVARCFFLSHKYTRGAFSALYKATAKAAALA